MDPSLSNRWLYIDFNSYFASVEQQLNPRLRQKPVAVVPVQTDSSCVIAASYEAKKFGIKTGTPIYEAKKLCPDLICVLAQHEAYVDFHTRILDEIDRHIPVSQIGSIDEMACELMENERSQEKATAIAMNIKQGIALRVGEHLKCSIGVAPNRYLAKVAADFQKPDGLTFFHATNLPQTLHSLKLRDLPGIGPNMELRLKRKGILDVQMLCHLDLLQMRKAWGSVLGERMWHHLRGIDLREIETQRKSLSQSHVLAPELRSLEKARQVARRLVLKASSRLRKMGYAASSMTLSLRTEQNLRLEETDRCYPSNDSFTFLHLLDRLWQKLQSQIQMGRIHKVSLSFHRLEEKASVHPDFLVQISEKEAKTKEKADNLSKALDAINQRYGRDSILPGLLPKEGASFPGTKIAFTKIPDPEEFFE